MAEAPGVPLSDRPAAERTGAGSGVPPLAPWVRMTVLAAAVVAGAARLPALAASLRPDESGFTVIARAWRPAPDSPYGPYWVDRPPLLIAVHGLTDRLGGSYGIRWLAVATAALFVLAAAAAAREVHAHVAPRSARGSARVVALTSVAAAALVANPSIDVVLAKGEVLALPLLMGSAWLTLKAVRRRSAGAGVLAGVLAGTAPGLKQSLAGALVLGVVLLALEARRGSLARREAVRLAAWFLAGAAVQPLATVVWAAAAGVRLDALWYAVGGMRSDALAVVLGGPLGGTLRNAAILAWVALSSGIALVLGWLLVHTLRRGRRVSSLAAATLSMAVVDTVALVLGASYWLSYLLALLPEVVLALALLLTPRDDDLGSRTDRRVATALVGVVVASSVVSAVGWVRSWPVLERPTSAVLIGRSIASVSDRGDTLTTVGGRADIQLASGLASPYPYLWSLPARVRDPGSRELAAVLAGPRAPTWVVVWQALDTWDEQTPRSVGPVLRDRYEPVGTACGGHPVYRLRGVDRAVPPLWCTRLGALAASG